MYKCIWTHYLSALSQRHFFKQSLVYAHLLLLFIYRIVLVSVAVTKGWSES